MFWEWLCPATDYAFGSSLTWLTASGFTSTDCPEKNRVHTNKTRHKTKSSWTILAAVSTKDFIEQVMLENYIKSTVCLFWLMTTTFKPNYIKERVIMLQVPTYSNIIMYDLCACHVSLCLSCKALFRRRTSHEPNWIQWVKFMWSTASEPIRNGWYNSDRLSRSSRLAEPGITAVDYIWFRRRSLHEPKQIHKLI